MSRTLGSAIAGLFQNLYRGNGYNTIAIYGGFMLCRMSRYAFVALATLACRAAEESSVADTSVAVPGSTTIAAPGTPTSATPATPGVNPADTGAASPRDQSVDAPDIPVRRQSPTSQAIVDTATLPTIQRIVAHHPQRVDSTIMSITEELNRTNRTPSAAWTALQDSVKQDIERLATIGEGALVSFFRQHYARFLRLTQMTP